MIKPTTGHQNDLNAVLTEVALVQFLTIRDKIDPEGYIAASATATSQQGGRRRHQCHIDQVLAGGEMAFDTILVDTFPSGEPALRAFDTGREFRAAAGLDAYVLAVKPSRSIALKALRYLGFLSPLASRLVGTTAARPVPENGNWNPNTGPVPKTIDLLRQDDQSCPFYMMNLNKYYVTARYQDGEDISGEKAYARYGNRIVPYLISVGGYPDLMGHVICLLAGDESSPLHDDWSEFAMVYYPSRQSFLRMMTNTPTQGIHHRDAGLERAVLMPSSSWPST